MYTRVHRSIMYGSQDDVEATQASINGRTNERDAVHTYNRTRSGLKKEGGSAPAATRMNPEDTLLSKISQSQDDKYCLNSTGMRPLE